MEKDEIYQLIIKANAQQTGEIKKGIQEEVDKCVHYFKEENEKLREEINHLKNRYQTLERKVRKNNLIIFGLKSDQKNFIKDTLAKINSVLGADIVEGDLNNIYSIGKSTSPPIVLEFVSFLKKASILKQASKFKGTGISISNDLSKEDREEQKILSSHLKTAKEQYPNAKIRRNKLIIGKDTYTVEQLLELEKTSEKNIDHQSSNEEDSSSTETPEVETEQQNRKSGSKKSFISEKDRKRKRSKITYRPSATSATTGANRNLRSQNK